MKSVTVASIKRGMNGKKVKFLGSYVLPEVPADIDEKLKGSYDVPVSVISFNTVDMLRTAEDGTVSHCSLKGIKAYAGDNGFLMTTDWNDGVNVMIYQFADKDNGGVL